MGGRRCRHFGETGPGKLPEAAAYLGVAKVTLRRWTRDGHLACVRIGKRGDRRFRREHLDEYIRSKSKLELKATGNTGARKEKRRIKGG